MPTTTQDPDVRRLARDAVRQAEGTSGWTAYEAAKGYARRTHPELFSCQHDAIIDAIKTRLEI
ncbi:hypothetical protein [Salinibacter altiplanensis]|uniref:hypothetical protein n=1 Tax=Salinibacter altiplanensis TaxID=1803181 RepID=UPI000C9F84DE|nr:hypothetical protein [Salinibacter altiplanensis]